MTKPDLPPCPCCDKPMETEFRPFCSLRCKQIDLGRWLDGTYQPPWLRDEDDPEGA
jgi:endogenous inhibitor of DNA gyrase (YacG/DUF329 family)